MWHRFPLTITTGSRPLKTCHEMDDVSQIIGSESSLRRIIIDEGVFVALTEKQSPNILIA
jgi:hypothetical protein